MKKKYLLPISLFLTLIFTFSACGPDDSDDYTEIPEPEPTSPVVVDLNAVPYPKLSDYKFYEGDMKNLEPALGVLPYDLNSTLFTDYAHKKRFVWMPANVKASYVADTEILEFPTGAVLIKNFYYDHVQPGNVTRIIETRLMIKKSDGWIFANYVWNDEQTEAFLDLDGSYTEVTWTEGTETKNAMYRIPSGVECHTCHKSSNNPIPIGPKPQNLNKLYAYSDGTKNQLTKWVEAGYLNSNLPNSIVSTVDWTDETQPIELRVRSYIDINCAHCHREGSHCDYRPMRFAFNETATPVNLGICVAADDPIPGTTHIVTRGNKEESVMYYRLNNVVENERMPLLGRTIIHTEAVDMIGQWIDSMEGPCP